MVRSKDARNHDRCASRAEETAIVIESNHPVRHPLCLISFGSTMGATDIGFGPCGIGSNTRGEKL